MTSSGQHPAILQELVLLADDLVGVSSGRELSQGLQRQLERIDCLPAHLYLVDPDGKTLYPAAAIGADAQPIHQMRDLPLTMVYQPGHHAFPLFQHGQPVGLLQVGGAAYDERIMQRLGVLLGPALNGVQLQEETLRELRQTHEQMHMLVSAGNLLKHLDLEVLLVRILETMLTAVRAQVGAVLTVDSHGSLHTRVTWGIQDHHVDAVRLLDGQRVVDAAFAEQRVLCYTQETIGEFLDISQLEAHLDGVLLLPLSSSERCHGVVFLANSQEVFDAAARRLGETVCNMAAIALDNAQLVQDRIEGERLRSELSLATTVQANMFPAEDLTGPLVQIAGSSRPCAETGGDYYTYLEHDGRYFAMIADVTGHGLGAALYTTMAHAVIQQQLRSGVGVDDCFTALSMALRHSHGERFMTAALVEIDPEAGRFQYVSAGHNPLLVLRADGDHAWLESTGLPLGILPGATCDAVVDIPLAPGDWLILYTDGFTEAVSPAGEQYGEDRLLACLTAAARQEGANPQTMMNALYAEVTAWIEGTEQADDLTLVVLRCAAGSV